MFFSCNRIKNKLWWNTWIPYEDIVYKGEIMHNNNNNLGEIRQSPLLIKIVRWSVAASKTTLILPAKLKRDPEINKHYFLCVVHYVVPHNNFGFGFSHEW